MFGRNAIARALGVKSAKMVSNSPAWKAIAAELQIPLARERLEGSPRTRRSGREGFDKGVEDASVERAERGNDVAGQTASHADSATNNKEITLRAIRTLAESRKPGAKESAEAIYDKYQAGEMDDDQVRKTVNMMLPRTK